MFDRLAGLVLRKPRAVLVVTLLLVVLAAGALGAGLTSRLTMGGYESKDTESARAAQVIEDQFQQGPPNLVLLVTDARGVDQPEVAAAGAALTERVSREAGVSNVVSYWTTKSPGDARHGRQRGAGAGPIDGDFDAVQDRAAELKETYSGTVEGLEVKVGGSGLMWLENLKTAGEDAIRAEAMIFPVVLVLLVIVFASLLAALVPLVVAISTVMVVMGLLFVLTLFLETSDLVTNVTTFLGLGLAIDYSLLFITRYREELGRGAAIPQAIRTMHADRRAHGGLLRHHAGRRPRRAFLALPFTIFQSAGIGAIFTGLISAAATSLIVPALLVWMGPRIDKYRIGRQRPATRTDGAGFWHNLAMFVMRRPVPILLAVLAFLLLLAAPVRDMKLRLPDEAVLPPSAQSAQVALAIREKFDTREQDVLQVVADRHRRPGRPRSPTSTRTRPGSPRSRTWPGWTRSPGHTRTARRSASPVRTRGSSPPGTPPTCPWYPMWTTSTATPGHRWCGPCGRPRRRSRCWSGARRRCRWTPSTCSATGCRSR